ncbi:MAG: anhydro-N-acetylmuramic acid kinase [Chloroflexi bacterium RIFCSPLOWO2_02_FULL_71_16]|nr:MAG: anhydro-N-acetylmuramic acid kinase [Chloroflexi bacterium RIFCSPLOWO2_02_FULL_71_16]
MSDAAVRAVGIMSGTSADGIDAVSATVSWTSGAPRVELHEHRAVPFTADLREQVLRAVTGVANVPELAMLHGTLGDLYAEVAMGLVQGRGADVIGLHGQTVAHLPASRVTLQIGDAARVAVRTAVPVVSDLRSADIAAGGEGAPLTPFADHVLFADGAPRVVLNLGGIANVTLLTDAKADHVRGFDTGPGNMVLDTIARTVGDRYDRDGAGARRGRAVPEALEASLAHPFFARRAPKSAGREEFGRRFALDLERAVRERGGSYEDALATATELTARTVAHAIREETPRRVGWRDVLVGGGGAANPALMDALRGALAPIPVRPTDELGVPAEAREALAFAILAAYRLRGLPNTLPRCTGASRAVSAGAIHAP